MEFMALHGEKVALALSVVCCAALILLKHWEPE